jgi:hypothetical protein
MREAIPARELQEFIAGLERHIHIERRERADGEENQIRVDHRFPDIRNGRFSRTKGRWRVTTKGPKIRLPLKLHGRGASEVNRVGGQGRGRALYCYDLERNALPIAAVAFHIDRDTRIPVQITGLALPRRDDDEWRDNLWGVWFIKFHLHALGLMLGRGSQVICEEKVAAGPAELELLGFRRAERIAGVRPSGGLFVQDL